MAAVLFPLSSADPVTPALCLQCFPSLVSYVPHVYNKTGCWGGGSARLRHSTEKRPNADYEAGESGLEQLLPHALSSTHFGQTQESPDHLSLGSSSDLRSELHVCCENLEGAVMGFVCVFSQQFLFSRPLSVLLPLLPRALGKYRSLPDLHSAGGGEEKCSTCHPKDFLR